MQTAMERLKGDLGGALRNMHVELERVEILAAALYGFSKPVPDYEPTFQHIAPGQLQRHELDGRTAKDN
jgi:hypothetical protein